MGTREHLIQVTSELIQEVGFEGLTTAVLARRAGVAEGTMYRHFPSKEALVEAAFAHIWSVLNAYMEAHLPSRSEPRSRLDAFLPVTLEALRTPEMTALHGLAQVEQMYYSASRGCTHDLPEGLRSYLALLEESITLAQAVGVVRPGVEPRLAAHFIFAGASSLMDTYADPHLPRPDGPFAPETVYAQITDFCNRILYGGVQ